MSAFAQLTPAPEPRTKDVRRISLFYAAILVIFSVAQLFNFDKFLDLMTGFNLPGGGQMAYFLTSFIVVVEVLALPFLLGMSLSKAFRFLSMAAGWLVSAAWIFVTIWVVATDQPVNDIGFLGGIVALMPGWWAIFISVALGLLAAWSSWGMWPGKRRAK